MFWGFITALASMILTTIFYVTDNMTSSAKGFIDYAIYIGGIVFCALAFKKTLGENDPFPYSRALGLGVATMMFASIILAVFTYVLYQFIDPSLIDKMIAFMEESYLQAGLDESVVEQQMGMISKFYTPALMSVSALFGGVFIGLIISLISSIFLQKKEKDAFAAAMNEIDDEE